MVPWKKIAGLAGQVLTTKSKGARFKIARVEPDGAGLVEVVPESTGKPRLITGSELEGAYALRLPAATLTSSLLRAEGVSQANPAYVLAIMLAVGEETAESSGVAEYRLHIWAVMDAGCGRGRYEARLEKQPAGELRTFGNTSAWAGTRQGALLEGFAAVLGEVEPGYRLTIVNPYNSPAIRTICLEDHSTNEKPLYAEVFRLLNLRACCVQGADGQLEERSFGLAWSEPPDREVPRLEVRLRESEQRAARVESEAQELREKLVASCERSDSLQQEVQNLWRRLKAPQAPAPVPRETPLPDPIAELGPEFFAAISVQATAELRQCFGPLWSRLGNALDTLHEAIFLEIIIRDDAFGHDSYALPAFTLARSCEMIANDSLATPLLTFLQKDSKTSRALTSYLRSFSLAKPTRRECNLSLRDIRLLLFDPEGNQYAPRPVELADRVSEFVDRKKAPWLGDPTTAQHLSEVNSVRNRTAHENSPVSPDEYKRLREVLLGAKDALIPRLLGLT